MQWLRTFTSARRQSSSSKARCPGLAEAFAWIAAAARRERRAYDVRATVLDLDSEGLGSRERITTTSR